MGRWAIILLTPVSLAWAASARGFWTRKRWGQRLAIGVLVLNLAGDVANLILRGDLRALIGLPIGGSMIAYLLSNRIKAQFREPTPPDAPAEWGKSPRIHGSMTFPPFILR